VRRTVRSARPDRPSARDVAVDILVRVDRGGAFANILLHHRLDRARLPAADAALATELVLGVLRHRRRLDWTLQGVAAHRNLVVRDIALDHRQIFVLAAAMEAEPESEAVR